MTLGQDASFTEEAFIRRYNADLANDLGNLLNRVLNMINRYCDGKIPMHHYFEQEEKNLWINLQQSISFMNDSVLNMKIHLGIEKIMDVVRSINKYLEIKAPWTAYKNDCKNDVETTLYTASECLRAVADILLPIMPCKMSIVRKSFGITYKSENFDKIDEFGQLPSNNEISQPKVLFPRIEVN